MHHIFPAALVACIRDGRQPTTDEIDLLAEKIWRESIKYWPSFEPDTARVLVCSGLQYLKPQ